MSTIALLASERTQHVRNVERGREVAFWLVNVSWTSVHPIPYSRHLSNSLRDKWNVPRVVSPAAFTSNLITSEVRVSMS